MKRLLSLAPRPAAAGALFLLLLALLAPVRSTPKADAEPSRAVYIAGGLSEDDLTTFSVCLAAARPDAVLLLDSRSASSSNRMFLTKYGPDAVVPVGSFPDGPDGLEKRLGVRTERVLAWNGGVPPELSRSGRASRRVSGQTARALLARRGPGGSDACSVVCPPRRRGRRRRPAAAAHCLGDPDRICRRECCRSLPAPDRG